MTREEFWEKLDNLVKSGFKFYIAKTGKDTNKQKYGVIRGKDYECPVCAVYNTMFDYRISLDFVLAAKQMMLDEVFAKQVANAADNKNHPMRDELLRHCEL